MIVRRLFCCTVLFCLLGPSFCFAQSDARLDRDPWVPPPRVLAQDAFDVTTAPLRMSRLQALETAGALGVTLALTAAVDGPVHGHFDDGGDDIGVRLPRHLAGPGRLYDDVGRMHVAGGTAALLALGGIARSDRRMTRTSVRVLEAVFLSKAVVGAMKTVVGRQRPYTGAAPNATEPLVLDGEHASLSFPSGHTAHAFSIATVLARTYDDWYVQIPAYAVAASVGMQRIESGKHWVSDVIVGATLGHLVGRVVTRSAQRSESPDRVIDYTPIVSAQRVGLSLRF